jgi:hypothetical protein
MNAGTCWGKNTIDPSGRGIEKPRKATLTLTSMFSTLIRKKEERLQNILTAVRLFVLLAFCRL